MTLIARFSIGEKSRRLAFLAAFCVTFSAAVQAQDVADPLEGFNRTMFSVNEALDTYALRPVAKAYDTVSPLPVKAGVGNFFGNVGELWVGANNALQGKVDNAGNGLARFLINSTVGIFGLFDVASELGFERYNEDFGQTLAVWGVSEGPYLYLPVIGPRTGRDFVGWAIDSAVDPVSQINPDSVRMGVNVLRVVDIRAGLLSTDKVIDEAAIDKYAYIRDAYLQRRNSLIFDGRPPRQED
jgi:phospholipid-binding lipoprotein MlaA